MSALHQFSTVTASAVTPRTARWAWDGRVPLGALTVLAGPPGQGKTQLLIGACPRITRGQLAGDLHGSPADALFVSAEDSVEHTRTPPGAIAAGADLERLHFFDAIKDRHGRDNRNAFQIPDDLTLLRGWLSERQTRLIVLDPIVAMLPTTLNAHRDQHVRTALAPLARLADELQVAVIVVMHLNKTTEGGDALNRLSSSIGFGGAARPILLFSLDPDDPEGETSSRRILAHDKCNVGDDAPSPTAPRGAHSRCPQGPSRPASRSVTARHCERRRPARHPSHRQRSERRNRGATSSWPSWPTAPSRRANSRSAPTARASTGAPPNARRLSSGSVHARPAAACSGSYL